MTECNENGYSFWADQASFHSEDEPPKENHSEPEASSDAPAFYVAEEKTESRAPNVNEQAFVPPAFASEDKKKRSFAFQRGFSYLVKAIIFGVVAGGAFIGFNSLYYHFNPSARPGRMDGGTALENGTNLAGTPIISFTEVMQGASIATADVSDIVDHAMPSLVSISCTFRTSSSFFGYLYEGTTSGSGSGIIIGQNEKELLIATNNHVVENAITTMITFPDGTEMAALIKGTDPSSDLAIVSIALKDISEATLSSIRVATLGDSDQIKVGQMVVAIGNALGYGQTTTVGYLSAKEREITVKDSNTGKSTSLVALQVDAAINPGNSGGALLNTKGEIIGINSAKLSSTSIEGIGYAIPISSVMDILTDLMNLEILTEEEQGYLGIEFSRTEITEEISAAYGWPIGVYITNVLENGAGAKYGILAGDIITHVNGTKVSTGTQLQSKITSYRCGTTVSITLWRMENGSYTEHVLDVVLGSRSDFETTN